MSPIQDAAAIVGIGATPFGRGLAQSEHALAGQAIRAALADAGLAPADVDGLVSYSIETTGVDDVAASLGIGNLGFFASAPFGGGAGCSIVGLAAMAVATGQAEVVVAWRARKRSRPAHRPWAQARDIAGGAQAFTQPFGLVRPADEVGMLTRRYMHTYGATRDHLANVALACRHHAQANPAAQMHGKPLTREAYHAARPVSEPLHLFDCCLESDGAAAVVVVSAQRARDARARPADIHAVANGLSAGNTAMTNYYGADPLLGPGFAAARSLWERSDFKPADVRVAQIYDAFTPLVLFSLEAYGFCGRGEGAAFSEGRALELGGRLPINTSGGGLSEAYIHGFNLIIEGVRQVRGTSGAQVSGAECCLVTSAECVPTSAVLLRR